MLEDWNRAPRIYRRHRAKELILPPTTDILAVLQMEIDKKSVGYGAGEGGGSLRYVHTSAYMYLQMCGYLH